MPFDLEFWKQREGQVVDSVFPLERCLGGDESSAVFETSLEGRVAAIRMVPGSPESIAACLARWRRAAGLAHPALVKILAHGEATLTNQRYAYLVMERAEDNLAGVLAERPLTASETRETLLPVIGALQYLDKKGLAPAQVRPSNILAFGEQVKMSSDNLIERADSNGAVLRKIGVLIEDMLAVTEDSSSTLPEPFAEIVRNCKSQDPGITASWSLAHIDSRLRGGDSTVYPETKSRRTLWLGVVAAGVAALSLFALFRPPSTSSDLPNKNASVPEHRIPAPAAIPKSPDQGGAAATKSPLGLPKPSPTGAKAREPLEAASPAERRTLVTTLDGVTQVLPDISQSSRRTISGRVRVNIRVHVDDAGRVTQATPEPPSVSKYFTDRAIAAARAWKFAAGNAPQDMVLRFELTREQTRVSVTK